MELNRERHQISKPDSDVQRKRDPLQRDCGSTHLCSEPLVFVSESPRKVETAGTGYLVCVYTSFSH